MRSKMRQDQFLSNMKYVFTLLGEEDLSLESDIYACVSSLYASYKLQEIIKDQAIQNSVKLFNEVIFLREEIKELNDKLNYLTGIK